MSEDVKEENVNLQEHPVVISDENITFTETGEVASIADLAASLETMEEGMEVTSEYYDFPMGDSVNCMYIGDLMIMGKNGNKVPAVRLLLANEKIVINASAVVVSTFAAHTHGKSFKVTKTGSQKSANGEYHTYKISELLPKA